MNAQSITIKGKYNTAVVYTQNVGSDAIDQIRRICDFEPLAASQIRVMCDVHAGRGCTIGTTMTIVDKVVPNMVGVDIGCGMRVVRLQTDTVDFARLDDFIRRCIPAGKGIRREGHPYNKEIDLGELRCHKQVDMGRAMKSIGTLGGGNHFIEVDRGEDGTLYLVIHSGSRQLGVDVANHYQMAANARLEEMADRGQLPHRVPMDMAYVEGAMMEDYLHDMRLTQRFASLNRRAIADDILQGLDIGKIEEFETIHNYIDLEHRILRKGAVSAEKGELLLIPLNMRDGALLCRGKGNPDWNCSAPHGAGRKMDRSTAKHTLSLQEYRREMSGIYTTSVGQGTLDESPMAYKSAYEILQNIRPTVSVVERLTPVYNFKAGN